MRRFKLHPLTFAFFVTLAVLTACTRHPDAPDAGSNNARRYDIEGRVIAVDKSRKEIMLDHKEIPGVMGAMTMPYRLQEDWPLNVAQPGDQLRGTLVITNGASYLDQVSINKNEGTAVASSTSAVHMPSVGDGVPDFSFIDQSGRRLRLAKLRGKPLLLTFIYTRCPLPDFCIRMSNNFEQLASELKQSQPGTYGRLQLLSISIDPEHDKPAVLKEYGKRYAGQIDPDFQHWSFASGTPAETRKAADFFGLSYNGASGQIVHSLRTVLVAPDGKIAALYSGNEWTPSEVEAELKKW